MKLFSNSLYYMPGVLLSRQILYLKSKIIIPFNLLTVRVSVEIAAAKCYKSIKERGQKDAHTTSMSKHEIITY